MFAITYTVANTLYSATMDEVENERNIFNISFTKKNKSL